MNQEPAEATESSYSELRIIRFLVEHWRKPLIGALLVTAIAALYALTWSRQYMAESALIVREPQVPMTGEAAPLSVEMLEGLANSGDVGTSVFLTLQKARVLPEDADFDKFKKNLEVEVPVKRGPMARGETLPMIILRATFPNPDTAKETVNKFAEIILDQCGRIYEKDVVDLSAFVGQAYQNAESRLRESEELLTFETLAANLAMKKARFERMQDSAITLGQDLVTLENDILTTQAQVQAIAKRVRDQELRGYWAGEYVEDLVWSDDSGRYHGFMRTSETLLSARSREIADLVLSVVQEERNLLREKERLDYAKKTNRLAVLRKRSEELATSITLQEMRLQQATDRTADVLKILSLQESDGRFAGEVLREYYMTLLQPAPLPGTTSTLQMKPALTTRTVELDQIIQNLFERKIAMAEYQEESGAKFKEERLKTLESDHTRILADLDAARKRHALNRTRMEALAAQINDEPDKLVLRKAISDEALWNAFLGKPDWTKIQTPLMTEEPNPVHQSLRENYANLLADVKADAEEISYLENREPKVREEIETLRKELEWIHAATRTQEDGVKLYQALYERAKGSYDRLRDEYSNLQRERLDREAYLVFLDRINDRITADLHLLEREKESMDGQFAVRAKTIERQRARITLMYQDYLEEKKTRKSLELLLLKKEADRDIKADQLDKLTSEYRILEEEIARDEEEQKILTRQVSRATASWEVLSTRSAEVENLKIAARQASRSGTAILYKAGENPAKLPLGRIRFILSVFVFSYLVLAFLLVLKEILREDESRRGMREGIS